MTKISGVVKNPADTKPSIGKTFRHVWQLAWFTATDGGAFQSRKPATTHGALLSMWALLSRMSAASLPPGYPSPYCHDEKAAVTAGAKPPLSTVVSCRVYITLDVCFASVALASNAAYGRFLWPAVAHLGVASTWRQLLSIALTFSSSTALLLYWHFAPASYKQHRQHDWS
jgi:hypothetical protein